MAIQIGYGETVTLHRWSGNGRDAHGKPIVVWTDEEIENVGVDIPDADENTGDTSDEQIVDAVLFLPAGMSASKRDQVTVRGLRYQVNGDALAVRNFFTDSVFPTPVKIRRVTG